MKQILQDLRNGDINVADVPVPSVGPGHVLIRTRMSLVSPGTERMLLEFGKAGWINKARQQPERVQQVLRKMKTDGLRPTLTAVRNRLDRPVALGYSNVGTVVETGNGVSRLRVGDRVLSNGSHAEYVCVHENLCAPVPADVDDRTAAFGVLGAIALQGIRLAKPELGEIFVVQGLGVIGLLAVQILLANGCRVIGLDFDSKKTALVKDFGGEAFSLDDDIDPVQLAADYSDGNGVDGVLICASTRSNEPLRQAPRMCRKRGRLILIGVVGLNLERSDFYEKEISFQVSCSYGPGRYDPQYEEKGLDYPIGFVRWTVQRNFEAVLQLMTMGRIKTEALVSSTVQISQAKHIYDSLSKKDGLGYLIGYPADDRTSGKVVTLRQKRPVSERPVVSFIGAGAFAGSVLLPAFKDSGVRLKSLASAGGVSGYHQGLKFGFEETTTDYSNLMQDPETDCIVIATKHSTHAHFVLEALRYGKHVFVEKPLCLTSKELDEISECYKELVQSNSAPVLMIGFNRRFSRLTMKMYELLQQKPSLKHMMMTVNAGKIPPDHWIQDPDVGGGRLIGEACHFIDLLRHLAGHEIIQSQVVRLDNSCQDSFSIHLKFADGSIGTVQYISVGNRSFPKERLEVFCDGRVLVLDNFRSLVGLGWKTFKKTRKASQDKGHVAEIEAFLKAVRGERPAPIPFEEILAVSKVCIQLANQQSQ